MFFMKSECVPCSQNTLESIENKDTQEVLVGKARSGDETAFATLVSKYQNKLYRLIYLMVHHEEDTWDLLQEAFLHAYQALHSLKDPAIFGAWVTRIAVNLSINHLKKRKRIRQCQQVMANTMSDCKENDSPEYILEQKETQEKLHSLIAQLPPKQRTVLILCDMEGYSYKEISQILQCHLGTVMSRLFYARDFIRQHLRPKPSPQ
jgi:RNA polymerase sigma-70 factor (ECF subfamily)